MISFPEIPKGTCIMCKGLGKKPPSTSWERTTKTLMSDGNILEKFDVRFQADVSYPKGRPHSYGWKLYKKVKSGVEVEDFLSYYERSGYTKE